MLKTEHDGAGTRGQAPQILEGPIPDSKHTDLDAAVSDAYGWPATLCGQETLSRLNAERTEEERHKI